MAARIQWSQRIFSKFGTIQQFILPFGPRSSEQRTCRSKCSVSALEFVLCSVKTNILAPKWKNGVRNRILMCRRGEVGKTVYIPNESVSGGLGSKPVQNLVALASTKSHPIFHCRRCVAIATRPSHLPIPYRACIFDLHHPLLSSTSQSITPHLISPLWLAFFLSCPPSNCWPSQADDPWITMRRGKKITCSSMQARAGMEERAHLLHGWE